jgi:hypothetical protein
MSLQARDLAFINITALGLTNKYGNLIRYHVDEMQELPNWEKVTM